MKFAEWLGAKLFNGKIAELEQASVLLKKEQHYLKEQTKLYEDRVHEYDLCIARNGTWWQNEERIAEGIKQGIQDVKDTNNQKVVDFISKFVNVLDKVEGGTK